MGMIEIIGGFIMLALCIGIVALVTLQEGKGGLGAIGGGDSGSFYDKNKGKTKEAMLMRATSIMGVCLVVVTLIVLFAGK